METVLFGVLWDIVAADILEIDASSGTLLITKVGSDNTLCACSLLPMSLSYKKTGVGL